MKGITLVSDPVWLVTGGCGFIGSNFILNVLEKTSVKIVNFDSLTYAGNPDNLTTVAKHPNYRFCKGDITDSQSVSAAFREYRPTALIHFAAESHVDRSITGPRQFVQTNVIGTFCLLEETRSYFQELTDLARQSFRFLHVSTDEVFGSLQASDPAFSERTPYAPNSPYSASKAASDQFVRAYFHTYNLPLVTTNCSNNYGPYQFPEKMIPLMILKALGNESLPVYGDGQHIRDWLYVEDHVEALLAVLQKGRLGETYNIGGKCELRNIDLVKGVCGILDEFRPKPDGGSYASLIRFVSDRPGHDRRYAIDTTKIFLELGWEPKQDITSGLRKTVQWYLDNEVWWRNVQSGRYRGDRLGLI